MIHMTHGAVVKGRQQADEDTPVSAIPTEIDYPVRTGDKYRRRSVVTVTLRPEN